MKIKPGVSIHGIDPAFHFIWPVIQATYHQYNNIEGCVITSGTEYLDPQEYPDRPESSLHYQGRAIDIRTRGFTEKQCKDLQQILQERFHEEFTIEFHGDHFHIEYHPSESSVSPRISPESKGYHADPEKIDRHDSEQSS